MGLIDKLLDRFPLDKMRVQRFKRYVEESPGTQLIDERHGQDSVELTLQLASAATLSDDLVRLLNTSHVTITDLTTENGRAYLTVRLT